MVIVQNLKRVIVVVKSALGIVKKLLINGGFVKLLWASVGLARVGKPFVVVQGRRIGDGSWNMLFDLLF